jgi:SLT domain-containing protein
MASLGTVFVGVKMDQQQALQQARTTGKTVSDELGKSGTTAGKSYASGFGNALKVGFAAGAGIAGTEAVLRGLHAVVSTGIGELKDYQAGYAQLQAGLKSTGGVAGLTANQMEKLASSIQSYSGQTDDSIVQSESLLLTFKNIHDQTGKNNDIFTQATKATADMAARFGGDASANAIKLGKALNDPVQGMSALSRMGIQFSESQKETIKQMVKTGDVLGAQKIILKEVTTEVGGSAKAYGQTLPGEIDRAKRAFEDFAQNGAQKAFTALTDVGGAVQANRGYVLAFVGAFVGYKAIPILIEGIGNAYLGMAAKIDIARAATTKLGGSAGFAGGLAIATSWGLAIAGAGAALQELAGDSDRTKTAVSALDQQFKTTSIDALQSYIDKLQAIKADPVKFKDDLKKLAEDSGQGVEATYNALGKEIDRLQGKISDITGQKKAAAAAVDLAAKLKFLGGAFQATPAKAFADMMHHVADAEKLLQGATSENNKTLSGQVDLLAGYTAQADITAQKLQQNLQQTLQTLAGEGANIQKLEAANLDPKFIKALVDKGPEYVAAAASSSLAEQKKLNDTYLQGESQRWHTAAEIARAESPAAAQAIAAGQAFTQGAIEKTTQDVQTLNFWLHALQDVKRVTFLSTGVPDVVGDITKINTALDQIGSSYVVSVGGGTGRKLINAEGGHYAQIGNGITRVWNEPETGGEAYIPLAPSKRDRSIDIWAQTGRSLGVFADGGILGATTVKVDTMGIGNSLFSGYGGIFSGGGGGGAGVQRLAGTVMTVLGMLGLSAGLLPKVLAQIASESGGQSSIVNTTDSNWFAGHPSVGDLQVIAGTYAAYAGPFRNTGPFLYGVSTNDLANIYAGVNYELHKSGPSLPDFGQGHGYDQGGVWKSGTLGWNTSGKDEFVVTGDKMDELLRLSRQHINVTASLAKAIGGELNGTSRLSRLDARTRT